MFTTCRSSFPQRRIMLAALATTLLAFAFLAYARAETGFAADQCNPGAGPFTPLTNSSFQGVDGDQCNSTGPLGTYDWQKLVDDGKFNAGQSGVALTDDDSQPNSVFKSGSKEEEPNGWDFVTGAPNNKTNVLAAWGYPDPQPNNLFLYLAFASQDAPGSTNLNIELNVNKPTETFTNSFGKNVIKRLDGDVLLTFDWTGGANALIQKCTWVGDDPLAPWLKGTWSNCVNMTAAGSAQGTVNGGFPITNFLPGIPGIPSGGTLLSQQFGEAAVNLTQALNLGNGVGQTPCADFGAFSVRTRQSPSITSNPSDIVGPAPVTVSNCGRVVIKKETNPASPTSPKFDFTSTNFNQAVIDATPDSTPAAFQLADQETEEIRKVEPGTNYTVTESANSDYDLTDISCTEQGAVTNTPTTVNVGTRTANIKVDPGELITCTYKNRKKAQILIAKDQVGGSNNDAFNFTKSGDISGTFSKSEAGGTEAISVVPNLGTGGDTTKTYTITEDAAGQPTGYDFKSITCYDGATTADPVDIDRQVTGASVNVKVAAGQTVLCVFTNVKQGQILVAKDQVGGSDNDAFNFTKSGDLSGTFTRTEAQGQLSIPVTPNLGAGADTTKTYTVAEDAAGQPAGYEFKDLACYDGSSTADPADADSVVTGRSVDVKVAAGATVLCVWRNVKQGQILVAKDQIGGDNADAFNFTKSGDLSGTFSRSEAQGQLSIPVTPNLGSGSSAKTYTIAEDAAGQPAGYDFKDLKCYDGSTTGDPVDTDSVVTTRSVDVKVAAGATVLCVWTNVKQATILVAKDQIGGSNADVFNFTASNDLPGGAFTRTETQGAQSFSVKPNLGSGSTANTYTVAEDAAGQPAGYDFKDLKCFDGSTTAAGADTDSVIAGQSVDVKVAAGATVLCVWTNVKQATILVAKDQIGGSDSDAFKFTASNDLSGGAFTRTEAQGARSFAVKPNLGSGSTANTYTVAEDAAGQPAGYAFKELKCFDGTTSGDPADADSVVTGRSVDVKVAAGATVLCVWTNVKGATILVAKNQIGGSDNDAFKFTASNDLPGGAFTRTEAQGAQSFSVAPNLGSGSTANTYTVGEDVAGQPAGYDFKDLSCFDGPTTGDPADTDSVVAGQSVNVKVAAGQTVLCVFTNVKRATILVAKDQIGGSNADVFKFTASNDLPGGAFTRTEAQGAQSFSVVPNQGSGSSSKTYTVAEDAAGQPAGYDFKDLKCFDGSTTADPADADSVITGQSVNVKVAAGATVLCVFTNVKQATILMAKDQIGGSNADAFAFTASGDLPGGAFTRSEAQGARSFSVKPNLGSGSTANTYTLAEDAAGQPAGYDFKDLKCFDGTTTGDPADTDSVVAGQSVNVKVAAGATVLCVWTNVKQATILVAKDQIGGSNADAFNFTASGDLPGGAFSRSEAQGARSFSVKPNLGSGSTANTYTVAEDAAGQPAGYDFKDLKCFDGTTANDPADTDSVIAGRSVNVKVAAGATVLCVWTNVKQATILVAKDQIGGSDNDAFKFTASNDLPGGAFTRTEAQGARSFAVKPNLGSGSTAAAFTVAEDVAGQPAGYDFKQLKCFDGSSTGDPADTDSVVTGRSVDVKVAAGATVLCVWTNVKRATILMTKDQIGGSDNDAFKFTASNDLPGGAFTRTEAQGARSFDVVPNLGSGSTANTYTLAEDAAGQPAGYDFKVLSCFDGSTTNDPADTDSVVTGQSVSIKVAAGATVLCRFTNVKRATILVAKDQIGGSDNDVFNFTASNDLPGGAFTRTEAQGAKSFDVAPNLGAGASAKTYTVNEDNAGQPAGFVLDNVKCYDGSTTAAPVDTDRVPTANGADIKVEAGATVLCVWTNVKAGRILVAKDQVGGSDNDDFKFTASNDLPGGAFTQSEADAPESFTVEPNLGAGAKAKTYTVAEDAAGQPAGYDFNKLQCFDGSSSGDPADTDSVITGQSVDVKVEAGTTVLCVFTNVKRSTILVAKDQVGGDDNDAFNFTASNDLPGGAFTRSEAQGAKSYDVVPNLGTGSSAKTYTVAEDAAGQPANYDFDSIACYDGSTAGDPADTDRVITGQSVDVKVEAGKTVLCVFTNIKRAKLEVEKQTTVQEGAGGKQFGFQTDAPGAGSFNLTDDGVETRFVKPGSYQVTEDAIVGYRLSDISCGAGATGDKAARKASYTVTAGQTTRCVFTNLKINAAAVVVKAGNEFAYHGDSVTYTFKVSNPGNSPLTDIAISDDRCSPITGPDKGGDATPGTLDPGETWTYSCTTTISATHSAGEENPIVNTVTVTAKDEQGQAVGPAKDDHKTLILHPAIAIDKTGPATAIAGSRITYDLAVTNPGDVLFDEGRVALTDVLCEAPPQVQQKLDKNGNADSSPTTFDPGDRWMYTCTVQTQEGQTLVDNTANVKGTDGNGRVVEATDNAQTTLQQPIQVVAPLRQPVKGTAKLLAPTGCRERNFTVRVTGRQIKTVTFTLDGKRIKTIKAAKAAQLVKSKTYKITVNPSKMRSGSVHRLKVRITYTADSQTKARTLTTTFQRCRRAVLPKFTG